MYRIFQQLPKLASALSDSLAGKLFLYLKLVYFSVSRKKFLKNRSLKFNLKYNNKKFDLNIQNNSDIAVLVEIFVLNEYSWKIPFEVSSVLDLGAHWGDTALYYSLTNPDSKIFSFEPMPTIYKRLTDVVSQFPNISTYNAALSNRDGEISFYFSENTLGNSVMERNKGQSSITVPAVTIDGIREKTGIQKFDLVKFDIEGSEKFLFEYPNLSGFARSLIGEIHLDLMPLSLEEIKESLNGFEVEFKRLKAHRYIVTAIEKTTD